MRILSRLLPSLSICVVTLLAALPWGVGSEHRFYLPHAVYAVVHYWTLRYPSRVPEWIVFVCGLCLDVMTAGPLGYWALVFLTGYGVAVLQSEWARGGRLTRWLLLAVALALLALSEWCLASLYYLELADWRPFAMAALGIALAYPLIALVLGVLDAPRQGAVSFSVRGNQRT